MNMEEYIRQLIKKLRFFGYNRFQVKKIIGEAIGQSRWVRNNYIQNVKIVFTLEKYATLGSDYLKVYSK